MNHFFLDKITGWVSWEDKWMVDVSKNSHIVWLTFSRNDAEKLGQSNSQRPIFCFVLDYRKENTCPSVPALSVCSLPMGKATVWDYISNQQTDHVLQRFHSWKMNFGLFQFSFWGRKMNSGLFQFFFGDKAILPARSLKQSLDFTTVSMAIPSFISFFLKQQIQGKEDKKETWLYVSSNIMFNFLAMVLMQIKARIAFSGPDSGDLCSMSNVSNKWALLDSLFIIVFAVPKLFISAEK